MVKNKIVDIVNKVYPKIVGWYGEGKKQLPSVEIHKNILVRLTGELDAEGEPADAEYDRKENKLFIYSDYNNSTEDVIRSIIHEYTHYLQSGSWMKRFYDIGYSYDNHPYEIDAKLAEEDWKMFA
tara:strand:- start:195 stop:569 length:375 start_codon:yes stop_codon:yes gene_type:complete